MNKILKLCIALVIGMLSCLTASAQHESEASMEIADEIKSIGYYVDIYEPWYGQVDALIKRDSDYKGEVVVPGKYYSANLKTYAKVSWVSYPALHNKVSSFLSGTYVSNWTNTSSFYIPASATEYPTRYNKTTGLAWIWNYADGTWYFSSNPNLKTAIYESPHPPFANISTTDYRAVPGGYIEPETEALPSAFVTNPFAECPSIKSIVVLDPNTRLHSIKGVLFKDYDEQQELVAYPQGRKDEAYSIPAPTAYIREDAFPSGCNLRSLELPISLTDACYNAFSHLTGLTSVIVNWTEPVAFFSALFSDETYTTCTLRVPDGTMADYATTVPWSLFANIVEKSAGVDSPVASSKNMTCDVYSISGMQCKSCVPTRDWQDSLAPGIYILRMSDGTTLKHVVK